MKRTFSFSSFFYPVKRKKRASEAEEAELSVATRFDGASAPLSLFDVPREIWAFIFSMAAVPNREYRR